MAKAVLLGLLMWSTALFAHPMGNFSVNHYAKLRMTPNGIELQYALDLAEIPTFELLRTWRLDRTAPQWKLNERAGQQAREWLSHLSIRVDGRVAKAKLLATDLTIADGAGNLPILRVSTRAQVDAAGGKFEYEDDNFPERAGWKEIVVNSTAGVSLLRASQSDKDISKALTLYPPDPTIAPPQDLRAEVEWIADRPRTAAAKPLPMRPTGKSQVEEPGKPVIAAIAQPRSPLPAPAPATLTLKRAPPGSVVRGDFLSKVLHQRALTPLMIVSALAAAFALGAAHALTPGHGKTIVAAYLVGSRGTLKHAAFLGAMVTFTHTIAVFALGLATLFLFRYIVPEKLTVVLGTISGLSIVGIGALTLAKRIRRACHSHGPLHAHNHSHAHSHSLSHTHSHEQGGNEHSTHEHAIPHDHEHLHARDHFHHEHDGHTYSHLTEEISWSALVALGASGGLVPCESALVLLLGAIALGRAGFGLLLLLSFSLGLALVLTTIGVLVLYAKSLLPEGTRTGRHPVFRWVPIISPIVVMLVGLAMTGFSLGWIQRTS